MNRFGSSALLTGLRRAALQLAIVTFGIATLVGSGGGLDDSICNVYPDSCGPQPPAPPTLAIDPPSLIVQVGSTAKFTAVVTDGNGTYSYQWRRSTDGGTTFADIPGATSKTLTLASVNLGGDGDVFKALAWQGTSVAIEATAQLGVSATPGLVFADTEFPVARWQATPALAAGYPSFAHSESQVPADGHPDAYRRMTVQVAPGSGVSNVTHLALAWTYSPAVQGAIRALDFAEDSILFAPTQIGGVETGPFIEQAGRRYLTDATASVRTTAWASVAFHSLRAQDFLQFDGPACGFGETCPDFSAAGAPIRFGYVRRCFGAPDETLQHGIDNWKVTVWRQ